LSLASTLAHLMTIPELKIRPECREKTTTESCLVGRPYFGCALTSRAFISKSEMGPFPRDGHIGCSSSVTGIYIWT